MEATGKVFENDYQCGVKEWYWKIKEKEMKEWKKLKKEWNWKKGKGIKEEMEEIGKREWYEMEWKVKWYWRKKRNGERNGEEMLEESERILQRNEAIFTITCQFVHRIV